MRRVVGERIACDRRDYGNTVAFTIIRPAEGDKDGVIYTHEGLVCGEDGAYRFVPPDYDYGCTEPTIELSRDGARDLMDQMWELGIRPTEYKSHSELSSTQRHLDDMRKIAFKFLDG